MQTSVSSTDDIYIATSCKDIADAIYTMEISRNTLFVGIMLTTVCPGSNKTS